MRVIVTGSRNWSNTLALDRVLRELHPEVIIHGGALGADSQAHRYARAKGIIAIVHFPDYDKHGRRAPLERNIAMLEAYPGAVVVACPLPEGTGTQHTMREAKKRGMTIHEVEA